MSDHATEQFLLSLAFLARVQPTKTIRPYTNSYWLKHIAENYGCTYPEGHELGPQYVSNPALIAAAIHAGFEYKTYVDELGYDSLNVRFNMSKTSLVDLDCAFRPNGGQAQDRGRRAEMRKSKTLSTVGATGGMAEWFKAHAWKACSPKGVRGSNPRPSASAAAKVSAGCIGGARSEADATP